MSFQLNSHFVLVAATGALVAISHGRIVVQTQITKPILDASGKQTGVAVTSSGHGFRDSRLDRYEEIGRELQSISAKARALHVKEIVRDRPKIEALLKERIDLVPACPDRLTLALLYEREGRYAESLSEWRIASHPPKGVVWTALEDPSILTHFGDLAMRVGNNKMAADMYGRAGGVLLKSGELDEGATQSEGLRELREAAHYASALSEVPHGLLNEALADFKIGMPLMQRSESARLNYGRLLLRLGHVADAKTEFRAAERLASKNADKLAVHRERIRLGLIQTQSVLVIKDGKATNVVKELPDKG